MLLRDIQDEILLPGIVAGVVVAVAVVDAKSN